MAEPPTRVQPHRDIQPRYRAQPVLGPGGALSGERHWVWGSRRGGTAVAPGGEALQPLPPHLIPWEQREAGGRDFTDIEAFLGTPAPSKAAGAEREMEPPPSPLPRRGGQRDGAPGWWDPLGQEPGGHTAPSAISKSLSLSSVLELF